MQLDDPREWEIELLSTIGLRLNEEKKMNLDWHMYYPVVDENEFIVGIMPADGIDNVEFEIENDELVRESKIKDFRTGFLSGGPYYHL